jgi:hypothetical protein
LNKSFKDYLTTPLTCTLKFTELDKKNVLDLIRNLKPKTSSGIDRLSNKLLQLIKTDIVEPFTLIINNCFNTGIFPQKLKIAKVLPLYKKNENFLFDNYRPVSILPSLSKVIEKIMHIQLYDHFIKNNLFYESQYGFRNSHSTELATLEVLNRIVSQMDKGEIPINIYLDLSKAFDTLDHEILLFKLQYYGVKDESLLLLRNYLSDRKQYVDFNEKQSDLRAISTGVPQGSILGPLLFIIYINDFVKATEFFKPIIYADDTALSAILNMNGNENQNLENQINNELDIINDWFKLNKLSLNISKTKAMVFHDPRKKVDTINLKINEIPIDFVEQFNYLGIILDSHLSWRPHVHVIHQKISKTVGILSKLKNFIPVETLLTLYNTLILPYLNYGTFLLGDGNVIGLKRYKKRSVRLIMNSKYNAHTSPIFKKLQLLKVYDLYALQELKFAYKFENQTLPKYFMSINYQRHIDRHNYGTRNAHRFDI